MPQPAAFSTLLTATAATVAALTLVACDSADQRSAGPPLDASSATRLAQGVKGVVQLDDRLWLRA